jgi:hypothetical protein
MDAMQELYLEELLRLLDVIAIVGRLTECCIHNPLEDVLLQISESETGREDNT